MNSPDQLTDTLFAALAGAMKVEFSGSGAILVTISSGIKQLSVYRILELRQKIVFELDSDNPIVQEAVEILDGQIVLREIAEGAEWR